MKPHYVEMHFRRAPPFVCVVEAPSKDLAKIIAFAKVRETGCTEATKRIIVEEVTDRET